MYIESFFDLIFTETTDSRHFGDNKNDREKSWQQKRQNIMTFDIDWRQTSLNDAYYHFEIVYFDRHLEIYFLGGF